MAVREVLKYPEVESVTLVDLDPEVTHLFQTQPMLTKLNQGALNSPKVEIVNADAFVWAKQAAPGYDFIVVDFPDPTNFSLGKLYTTAFYRELHRLLDEDGVAVVQSTSPLVARKSFWCVNRSLTSVGLNTMPYHAYVPSFGEWGFIMAGKHELRPTAARTFPKDLKFLNEAVLPVLLEFPPDMGPVETEVNQLNNQALVRYYEEEWARYPGSS
jgi:spermidine synthase